MGMILSLWGVLGVGLATLAWSQVGAAQPPSTGPGSRQCSFDDGGALVGWTIHGDAAIDLTRSHVEGGGSLKVAPGDKALLQLRDTDESGRVELWIYDDGTRPDNTQVNRTGPRWGLVQNDGRLLAVGILYAGYLGGDEGYTATACDGKDWFNQLFWLGVKRAPVGWHKWTFDSDAETSLRVLHNDRELTAVDPDKTGLTGFAGLLLGDAQLANINRSFPKVSFGEDEQTAYGDCWTGAKVVFAGHSGIDAATGEGRARNSGWGPDEHLPPSQWQDGAGTSESYRRCCTSVGWVAQALAIRLLHSEAAWHHDAFLDYVDRWMFEDDAVFVKVIKDATGRDHDHDWARQGQAWDRFVNDMWARHRGMLNAPISGWKEPHDDTPYRFALEHPQK